MSRDSAVDPPIASQPSSATDRNLALVGQDPRFGGGALSLMEAFWEGAVRLGWKPRLFYMRYRGLRGRSTGPTDVHGISTEQLVRGLDAVSHRRAARRLAPHVARATARWVVAAVASHGFAAVESGEPYSCWIASGLAQESAARAAGLGRARRGAMLLNRRGLRRIERAVLQGAHAVYAASPSGRDELAASAELDASTIRILPIPVDTRTFTPEPDERWVARLEAPTIVFVGRAFDPRKNVRLLLDAFALVRARRPNARLRLIGAPPATAVGPGVDALGHVDSVADHLRAATLLVMPSRQEGFGIVAAEALASGVPVVTTPCGGPEELVRNSGGGSVLCGFEPEEMATTIEQLLGNPAELAAARARGRAHVVLEHSYEQFISLLSAGMDELAELPRDA